MNFSEDNFKQLEEQLKVKEPHLNQLKQSIQQQATKKQKSRKPMWLVAFGMLCLCVVTFPFYQPALADIVAKLKPLAIGQQNGGSPELTGELYTLLESNGYAVNSVGILTKENEVVIGIVEGSEYNKEELEALIFPYLLEQGYDTYTIDIQEMKHEEFVGNPQYDEVNALVKEVFADFGYGEEADYELASIQGTWNSNILTVEMPDHIKEADEIIAAIEVEIEKRDLDVKKVEMHKFNLAHRKLDNAWATAASTIYNAMAGQSTYKLNGMSYSVKKGHATITLKTAWTEAPSDEMKDEIEREIFKYLQSEEVHSYLSEPSYTIRFVNGEKTLLVISNK